MQFKRFKSMHMPPIDGILPSEAPQTPRPEIPPVHRVSQFKEPLTPWHGVPSTDETSRSNFPQVLWSGLPSKPRISQFKELLTPWHGVPSSDVAAQFKEPLASWHRIAPAETAKQAERNTIPGGESTHGARQFKVRPITSMQPIKIDPRIRQQVTRYADWLAKQAKYDVLNNNAQEINDYIQNATKVVKVGKNEVATFAPFRPELSALQTFTNKQAVVLGAIIVSCIIGMIVFRLEMLAVAIAAISLIYFSNLMLNVLMAIRSGRHLPEEKIDAAIIDALKDADWPLYTILCPLYREAGVVPQFVEAMQRLDYPAEKLQVLFLTEVDDTGTRSAIRALSLPSHFKILTVPDGKPRTKPRACNFGLMQATGPYIVIYDAEDIPDPLQLKKAVLTFANHRAEVACVQAKLNFYNIDQNLLTRWFTAEYSVWFDLILPGLQQAGLSLPLGGTSNHFRTAALRALGGWDAYNVTEDCDLGLRLARYHLKTVVLDSTTYEEANSQLKNWLRQRSRWIKGYMQTYLVHMRQPLEYCKKGRLYDLLSFQMVVGSGTGILFINPLMWALLLIYIIFGPAVIDIYHVLFAGPILYISAFCLIFGNFFYVYLYLLGCMKRKEYRLIPWTLLIPCYWALISVAGCIALFELIAKPHYWQKTVHGLHLKGKQAYPVTVLQQTMPPPAEEPTTRMPKAFVEAGAIGVIPSITTSLKAISTLLVPAISHKQKYAQQLSKQSRVRDLWFVTTLVSACITSIAACWYYFQQHEILLYEDALSHMRIARSVFDSATPGLAQLGSIWLPLPHILMWPFIWNNYLWHSGLAGNFVSMLCYVVASAYLFLSARNLTRSSGASFVGTLVFILNPNVLYLQSTPLSETVCMATTMMACYYFLCWTQQGTTRQLIFSAGCTFLATLARYDGWSLFLAIMCLIPIIGWMKRQRLLQIEGNLILFGVLGGFGIVLWFIWNQIIFGDPLFFQHGLYSSQAQQLEELKINQLFTYHNIWQSIRYYTIVSEQTIGLILFLLAVAAVFCLVLRYRFTPATLGTSVFLVPFAFYILALYTGQAIIWVPGANPPGAPIYMYNVRYGAQMVAPAAFFIATLIERLGSVPLLRFRSVGHFIVVGVIIVQSILTTSQGIIALQDGQYNYSCLPQRTISRYLAEHYNGGKILQDVTTKAYPNEAGIDFKHIIYQGSSQFWFKALANPASSVDWIIINPHSRSDLVAQHIDVNSLLFLSQFTLVVQQTDDLRLYHRLGRPPLPTRTLPPPLEFPHHACF